MDCPSTRRVLPRRIYPVGCKPNYDHCSSNCSMMNDEKSLNIETNGGCISKDDCLLIKSKLKIK